MFQVVDAECGGLRIGDRAQVRGDLETEAMRFRDRGGQFVVGDVHVPFERGDALAGPVVHHAASVVGAGQLVHLDE